MDVRATRAWPARTRARARFSCAIALLGVTGLLACASEKDHAPNREASGAAEPTVEVGLVDEVKETLSEHWEWMWTFVLGPVGALMWRRRRQRLGRGAH